ncbi:PREDICTED: pro-resilin-like isoform X2 [Dinoponera quadriceps]|uniref:Pro-resilin-like isoform X2 n=1 Tax=Dinoponera quadriceps TaxID=609295 RepID=A0A6P3YEF7_DINQU|nr:PREDICTED: pro-resilin-like isoform X2 [Dinoponera quadriceps]
MNCHQLAKLVLVLSYLGSDVLAGLLPGGDAAGYQYNRPGSGGFVGGGGFNVGADAGFNIGGGRGDFGSYRRPTQVYGPPGGGGGDAFNRPGAVGGAFGPSTSYRHPQFGDDGSGSYQDRGLSGGYQGGGGFSGRDTGRPQPYSFQYEVVDPPSGNDYAQRENSDGNVVQGEYRVLLPDSRTQIVRYMADDVNGYNADVQYEGQAQFPRGGGPGGYQSDSFGGGYQGGRGGFSGGGFIGSDSASNQYLPPRNTYLK